jgi:hypothetical protein
VRIRTQAIPSASLFEGFHPWLWVLAFIALVFISIAWLDITRPPPIRPSFHSIFSSFEEMGQASETPEQERTPLFTAGIRPPLPEGISKEIGDCEHTVTVEVDGLGRRERVCMRTAVYKTHDGQALCDSLIVDIFKNGDWLLRQELDRGLFRAERFQLLRDLDMDGRAELITLLSAGPEGSGADVFRIYKFDGYTFVEALLVFGLPPQDASVAFFLRHLVELQEEISARYAGVVGSEDLCADAGDEGDCFAGSPWLLDSNGDGRLELVQLLEPPDSREASKTGPFQLFVKEFRRRGMEGLSRFHVLGPASAGSKTGSILFHRSTEGPVMLLAAFADPGARAAPSSLAVFEIAGTRVKRAPGLGGFPLPDRFARLHLADKEGPVETRYLK